MGNYIDHTPKGHGRVAHFFRPSFKIYQIIEKLMKDPTFKFVMSEQELWALFWQEFEIWDNQVAGDLIDLLGFETSSGEIRMNLLEGLTASILYNHSYSVEEKMSLLLIMYDF